MFDNMNMYTVEGRNIRTARFYMAETLGTMFRCKMHLQNKNYKCVPLNKNVFTTHEKTQQK